MIGVSRDTDVDEVFQRRNGAIYVPFAQHYEPTIAIVGRASGTTSRAIAALASAVHDADSTLALQNLGSGPLVLASAYEGLRVVSSLAGAISAVALLLTMLGLHGILSHLVSKRTREVGLRMALGADRRQILVMILRDGLTPVAAGLAIGLGVGVALRVVVRSVVPVPVSIVDPLAFVLVAAALVMAGALACYWPARRAASVDPNVALRDL